MLRFSTIIIRRYGTDQAFYDDIPFLRTQIEAPDSFWYELKTKKEAVHTVLENGKHVDIHVVISQERDN